MGNAWFAWEMGWKLSLQWHMIKQMGNGKNDIIWDMMNWDRHKRVKTSQWHYLRKELHVFLPNFVFPYE